MEIIDKNIDAGRAFDWGRTSGDYARYRDIYPAIFYEKIAARKLCIKGQRVLDLGTGTGVLPRNMYHFGAEWIGTDISENQIAQAKRLSEKQGLYIQFQTVSAENIDIREAGDIPSAEGCFAEKKIDFIENTFDVVTACQCFWYFDHKVLIPKLVRLLKPNGRLLLLYMAWLPFEDEIAGASEKLVLKYNPDWTGARETKHPIHVPDCVYESFEMVYHEEYELDVPFTRESWNGRMKACRGVGASLPAKEIKKWETEHKALLDKVAPEEFCIRHYAAMVELKKR